MSVIPVPQSATPADPVLGLNRPLEAHVQGTFRSPRGLAGTMVGRVRLEGFDVVDEQLRAICVISGELFEADGTTIGVGSRRRAVPASTTQEANRTTAVVIGPADIDVMGLSVRLAAFTMPLAEANHEAHQGRPSGACARHPAKGAER